MGYAAGHLQILDPASCKPSINLFTILYTLLQVLFVFTAKAPVDVIFTVGRLSGVWRCHQHLSGLCRCRSLRCRDWLRPSPATAYMGIPLFLTVWQRWGPACHYYDTCR